MSSLQNVSLTGDSGNKVRTTPAERKLAKNITNAVLEALGAQPEDAPEADPDLVAEAVQLGNTGQYTTASAIAKRMWKEHHDDAQFDYSEIEEEVKQDDGTLTTVKVVQVHPKDRANFPKPREASQIQNIFRKACDELGLQKSLRDQIFKEYGKGNKSVTKKRVV